MPGRFSIPLQTVVKHSASYRTSMAFLLSAVVLLFVADLEISTIDPWGELGRMGLGLITPRYGDLPGLMDALVKTAAFAFSGVALAMVTGFFLALVYHHRVVRWGCSFLRSIHELFWALLFLQFLGLNTLTGVLAIAVPYAGTFAKVYSEILDEADPAPSQALPAGSGRVSILLFAQLPGVWRHLINYTSYRLECGLRSSAVLGFVGLPTLGYYLESYFSQGGYREAAALILVFYLLIATLPLWAKPVMMPFYLSASVFVLWEPLDAQWVNVARFFTQDIVPAPLRGGPVSLGAWLEPLTFDQALPGLWNTLVLSQIALVFTGLLALVFFPLVSRQFLGRYGRMAGHTFLVVLRSTPEYVLVYVFLQLWGPSMLPAIAALALHNGAIIGHLTGRHADAVAISLDAPKGLNRYGYEILPRVYNQFLAFLFYRWEMIIRETAILGILGIRTLGFFVDDALAELRLDRAVILVLFTSLVVIGVDTISRTLRARLRLSRLPGDT